MMTTTSVDQALQSIFAGHHSEDVTSSEEVADWMMLADLIEEKQTRFTSMSWGMNRRCGPGPMAKLIRSHAGWHDGGIPKVKKYVNFFGHPFFAIQVECPRRGMCVWFQTRKKGF